MSALVQGRPSKGPVSGWTMRATGDATQRPRVGSMPTGRANGGVRSRDAARELTRPATGTGDKWEEAQNGRQTSILPREEFAFRPDMSAADRFVRRGDRQPSRGRAPSAAPPMVRGPGVLDGQAGGVLRCIPCVHQDTMRESRHCY